jgi:alkanesulfonate monooxygenase SsuD/methylene tetrahydromethanopterin reductase-like flavin-dependent oxidoreductase (luciferase family)
MALSFGVTVLPDPPYTRFLELIEAAEQRGFEYGWTYDSHILWHESTPLLTLTASRTPARASRRCSRARTRRCTCSPAAA